MKPTKEQMEAYKMMALQSPESMKGQIEKHLVETCPKYIGNEDKTERCIKYLTDCAREILDGKNGDLADDVCFKICRDYFNDEIWKAEDEEKARREKEEAERKAKSEKRSKAAQGKKYPKTVTATATIDDAKTDNDDEDDTELENRYDLTAKPEASDGQLDMFAMLGV